MKPVKAWAIGLYVGGRLTGIARWMGLYREEEPCIFPTKAETLSEIKEASIYKGVTARPVRVTITVDGE